MSFYNLCLWLAGPLVETLIILRAVRAKWVRKYRFFFAYICGVLLQDLFLFGLYLAFGNKYYTPAYWAAEVLSAGLGIGVTYEIFKCVLGRYPGAGKMARNVLAFIVIGTFSKNLVSFWTHQTAFPAALVELERDLRVIQALCLLVVVVLIAYYRIPLGRNARGLLSGYGIFLGCSVVTLTLRSSLGMAFQKAWISVQPLAYLAVLCLWCALLWNYEPNPQAETHAEIETDYRSLARVTRKSLVQAREFLTRAVRP